MTQEGTQPPTSDSKPLADPERLADRRLANTFRTLIVLGLGLILLGSVLQFIIDGQLHAELIAPAQLFSALFALDPRALTTLGFTAIILGPATGLLTLLWTYGRQNERLAPVVALLVFLIIILSIPIEQFVKFLTGGG